MKRLMASVGLVLAGCNSPGETRDAAPPPQMTKRSSSEGSLLSNPASVPAIDARVVAVTGDPPLVLLSVGSDDRVQPGYRFAVRRDSEFVGQVIVEKVLRDSSTARVTFTAAGMEFQPGDAAATR